MRNGVGENSTVQGRTRSNCKCLRTNDTISDYITKRHVTGGANLLEASHSNTWIDKIAFHRGTQHSKWFTLTSHPFTHQLRHNWTQASTSGAKGIKCLSKEHFRGNERVNQPWNFKNVWPSLLCQYLQRVQGTSVSTTQKFLFCEILPHFFFKRSLPK